MAVVIGPQIEFVGAFTADYTHVVHAVYCRFYAGSVRNAMVVSAD
jgi:hypothetical protein